MRALSLLPLLFLALSCGGSEDDGDQSKDTATNDTGSQETEDLLCTEPEPPACLDSMILDLSLHDDLVSDGEVTTTQDGDDFVTVVDATAGGMYAASDHPWVYVRFDEDGAHRVDIDDETAAEESMEWHLALRRYMLRLNGGDGGPSCVGAYEVRGKDYADVDSVPSNATFEQEDFYNDDCEVIGDDSGLGEMSPDFLLGDWWAYDNCVQTTLVPFLVQLETGRVIKLVVEAYYETGQEDCNAGGGMGSGHNGGVITLRWRFLE